MVRVVPLVESWQRPPTNAPRAVPNWLDIFPISARVAPQVHPLCLSYCGMVIWSSWDPLTRVRGDISKLVSTMQHVEACGS